LSDSVVDLHEVGVLHELGDDFSRAHPLSLVFYRCDRHEALLRGSVHPTLDLVKGLCEDPNVKVLTKTLTPFVPLPVAFTSGSLVLVSFVCGCIGRQHVCGDILEISIIACP
jgi:hypothetical protein